MLNKSLFAFEEARKKIVIARGTMSTMKIFGGVDEKSRKNSLNDNMLMKIIQKVTAIVKNNTILFLLSLA